MYFDEFVGYKYPSKVRAVLSNIRQHPYHMHKDSVEIITVLDGELTVFDSTLRRDLVSGDVYIFNAMEGHALSSGKDNIALTIQIDLSNYKSNFKELVDSYFLCDSYASPDKNSSDLYQLRFLAAKTYFDYSGSDASDRLLTEDGIALLSLLIEKYSNYLYSVNHTGMYEMRRKIGLAPYTNENNRTYRIINYIYDHCREPLRIGDIAKMEFLSVPYLSRALKKNAGLSFTELLALARCDEAEKLLIDTDKSIDDIAIELGFANRYHLCKNFKRWFGDTPSNYRRRVHASTNGTGKIVTASFDIKRATKILNAYLDGYTDIIG